MKLSTARGHREAERRRRARRIRHRRAWRLAATAAVALAVAITTGLSLGGRSAHQADLRDWATALRNLARAQLAAAPSDSLRIDIKFKHLHQIHTKRDEALASGMLIALGDDFVPGSIALRGATVPIRMRLIGPEPDHLAGDLWSLEVRVRGDAHIEGMRRFALHAPGTVAGPLPLVAAAQLERAGLVAPRTSLVEVAINGDELGLAVLIELPSPELLRARGRRAAPIVRLDARAYWEALRDNARAGPFDNLYTAPIVADSGGDDAATAIALLRGFLEGALPAHQVFDLDATARWLASAELWGDPSCVHWTRARFYLDRLTARLAPIPALPERPLPRNASDAGPRDELIAVLSDLGARLLSDDELRHRFARELRALADQFAQGAGPGTLVAMLRERQEQALLRLHRWAPFTRPALLAARAERLASLDDIDATRDTWFAPSLARGAFALPSVVAAYAREDEQGSLLDLHNLLPIPVSISTLRHDDRDGSDGTPVTLASRVTFPIRLEPTPVGQRAEPVRVRYRQPKAAAVPKAIRGVARIAGDHREYGFLATPSPLALVEHPIPTTTLDQVLAQHPFLRREPGDLALHTQPGHFDVDGSLVMPPAMALVIEAGTELVFAAGEGMVTSGPLDLRGTADEPVVLRGADSRRGPRWQGVALLGSPRTSTWSHADISGATGLERPGWRLPAAVTLRRATVQLDSVRISKSRAPAAFAAIAADLDASDLTVEESSGAALLLRGTRARLRGLSIDGTGGDGIEAIDSQVEMTGGSLRRIHATAIQAADGSNVTAKGIEIAGASVAAASKNGAVLTLMGAHVRDIAHVPFLAFADRPELGGGELQASGNDVPESGRIAIAQRGSRVVVDGIAADPVDAALGDLRID